MFCDFKGSTYHEVTLVHLERVELLNVSRGYLNNTEATKNAITEDGWLKTGDLAKQDLDGFWWIVGRSKELIKYKVRTFWSIPELPADSAE